MGSHPIVISVAVRAKIRHVSGLRPSGFFKIHFFCRMPLYELQNKELKFIHITKCAGTSIENAGNKHGIKWGRWHEEYYTKKTARSFWHICFSLIDESVVMKYDWFMVVRNPYDRILSEYYCTNGGIGKKNIAHSIAEMNNYLINKITNRWQIGDHYTEQYKYLHPLANIHIIKFENLLPEFNALMSLYNMQHVVLKEVNMRHNPTYLLTKFTVRDFSKELIDLINTVYDQDFTKFNYQKMIGGT